MKLRFGNLKCLPKDYQGERHVERGKFLGNRGDQEWFEFEEVPGPDPNPPQRGFPTSMNIVFVAPHPEQS
jgi:hypothetical protein